jgi:hypothetical protein
MRVGVHDRDDATGDELIEGIDACHARVAWAEGVSCAAIRRKGDLAASSSIEETVDAERSRFVSWWWSDDGRRFELAAALPAASGAVVARALQRVAERVPVMPGEDDPSYAEARRADALVALCSARLGADPMRIGPRWWCMPPCSRSSQTVGDASSRAVG